MKKLKNISPKLELLDKKQITKNINKRYKKLTDNIIILKKINSTNNYLSRISNKKRHANICLSESQYAGKGRLGKKWISPYARNIYLSLFWNFKKKPNELVGLNIAIAIAVIATLKSYGIKKNLALKWPNDVLWRKRKLAGILLEICSKPNHTQAIIGVGLNVNMPKKIAKKIEQKWCDIAQITKTTPQRNKLVGLLLNNLLNTVITFQAKGIKPFVKQWQKLDFAYGKKITITTTQQQSIVGISQGIDSQGCLLLKTNDNILPFAAGEISAKNTTSDIIPAKSCRISKK